jgi:hypothetical protein
MTKYSKNTRKLICLTPADKKIENQAVNANQGGADTRGFAGINPFRRLITIC